MSSKSRLAAGCYFQTGDGGTTSGTSAVVTATATGTPAGGAFSFIIPWGFNQSVQPGAGTVLAIPFNGTASAVQTLINALMNVGLNAAAAPNVLVGGGPWPATPLTFTAQNDLANRVLANWIASTNAFTGGTAPNASTALTTPGVASGEAFSNISELTTLPFPQVKRAKKEV